MNPPMRKQQLRLSVPLPPEGVMFFWSFILRRVLSERIGIPDRSIDNSFLQHDNPLLCKKPYIHWLKSSNTADCGKTSFGKRNTAICNLLFAIRYLLLAITNLQIVICNLLFVISKYQFANSNLQSAICKFQSMDERRTEYNEAKDVPPLLQAMSFS